MKYFQNNLKAILFGLSAIAASYIHADVQNTNELGQNLWSSKTENDVLRDKTQAYNERTFKSQLSPLGLHEWNMMSRDQQQKAMAYADKTQLSPDAAVLKIDPNF